MKITKIQTVGSLEFLQKFNLHEEIYFSTKFFSIGSRIIWWNLVVRVAEAGRVKGLT